MSHFPDAKTSSTSTAPYGPEKLKEILEVVKEVRGKLDGLQPNVATDLTHAVGNSNGEGAWIMGKTSSFMPPAPQ